MCSPRKKKKTHTKKWIGSKNARIDCNKLIQIRQKANVHNPLSDTRVLISECGARLCVCVCESMHVWTIKVQ